MTKISKIGTTMWAIALCVCLCGVACGNPLHLLTSTACLYFILALTSGREKTPRRH